MAPAPYLQPRLLGRVLPRCAGRGPAPRPDCRGSLEKSLYYVQYAATLDAYEDAFGAPPPPDIWPAAARRFGKDPKAYRVNPVDVMVLDRRFAMLGAVGWVALGVALAVLVGVIF